MLRHSALPAQGRIGSSRRSLVVSASAAGPARQQVVAQKRRASVQQQQVQSAASLDAPTFWARAGLLAAADAMPNQQQQQQEVAGARQQQQQQRARGPAPLAAFGAATALGAALLALLPADAAHAAAHGAGAAAAANAAYPDLAEGQEFWGNVARYGRYFVTVMLGTGYVMVRPLLGLFKNPLTGALAVVALAGALYGVKVTLDAMLGLSEPFEYLPPESVGF